MIAADELAYMSAAEIGECVRSRVLSPVKIVDACIARIERRNFSLNAFVFMDFDDARREARAAEGAITSGATIGPLHGVSPQPSKISVTSSRVGNSPSAASGPCEAASPIGIGRSMKPSAVSPAPAQSLRRFGSA
jgi:hypothetical protein